MKITYLLSGTGLGLLTAASGALLMMRARDLNEARRVRGRLEQGGVGDVERFHPDLVAELPDPARRYLVHAIDSGAPLARSVVLEMGGAFRTAPEGPWMPMQAREVLTLPDGFLWQASVGQGLTRISGADSYFEGRGRTSFRLWGIIPVARASGPDVSRSAQGRLAGEGVWNPAALLPQRGVAWEAVNDRTARATLLIHREPIPLTLVVEPDGRLRSVTVERWGDRTEAGHFALIPFGVEVVEERSFGGYTVPGRIQAGWWYGTDRYFDFFHAEIRSATYRWSEPRALTDGR